MRVKPLSFRCFPVLEFVMPMRRLPFCQTKPPEFQRAISGKAGSVFPPCLFHPPGQGNEINASFHTILLKAFY
ncbi:hypothetical cytosolic protein [Syntrophus aciditrophicus SB]|uniref:Hypothetical cytosolic protein n=1 Tax=Syntrophus aciditrophicus (strain SB) TaxID=56780 RepID=Q2LUW4_SYNAS|nr:hypothetical cytosolic protein [Syntrophus aciditrophicus SB]